MASRSAWDWATRLLAAALTAWLGWAATMASLANVYAPTDVTAAAQLAPNNGRIAGDLARVQLQAAPQSTANQDEARRLAVAALLREPTAVSGAATLGLLAELRGDLAQARRDFGFAQRLSRRDLSSELWLIEDAVRRGDVAEALRHYDIALRTQAGATDILYPVLARASVDPAIMPLLGNRLLTRPPWTESFIVFLANATDQPEVVAGLFERLQRRGLAINALAQSTLVGKLLAAKQVDGAWAYYASLHPGAERSRSRDPNFSATADVPTAFDWQASRDAGVSVSIQRGASSGVATFSAAPTVGGTLIQQLQLLPPGRYSLVGRSEGIDQAPEDRPYWLLQCTADGRELGRLILPNSAERGGRFAGEFQIDAACPVQMLMLVARPSTAAAGLSGAITQVQIGPRRGVSGKAASGAEKPR